MINRFGIAAALTLCLAAQATGQVVPRRFQVSVEGGWQNYAESTLLKGSAFAGLHAAYFLTSNIGIGGYIQAGRPIVDGNYLPLVRHSYLSSDETNDTTLLYRINQQVTHLQLGVDATLRYAIGRVAPYVIGGAGRYQFYLDPQQENGLVEMKGFSYLLGGGVEVRVGEFAGVRLQVADQVFTDFDRDEFCVNCTGSNALLREDRFPNPTAKPPEKESTVHNLRFVGSFSFVPGGAR